MTAALLLTLAALSTTDDGSGALGVGGSVMPMKSHKSIRMIGEVVKIEVPSRMVEATFRFRNEGPKATATMIFPETGYVGEGDPPRVKRSAFKYFKSWVDGKASKVKRLPQYYSRDDGLNYESWWTKTVHFEAKQVRNVVNRYQGGMEFQRTEDGGNWGCTYVLRTGASWKGEIGWARIECDVSRLSEADRKKVTATPEDYERIGDKLIWRFHNFEPTEEHNIEVLWPTHSSSIPKFR